MTRSASASGTTFAISTATPSGPSIRPPMTSSSLALTTISVTGSWTATATASEPVNDAASRSGAIVRS